MIKSIKIINNIENSNREKSMKTKSSYLQRIIKSSTQAKQEKTRKKKITNIKNERGAITTYAMGI